MTVTTTGPLFDGLAELYVKQMVAGCEMELAAQAMADVHANLNASIKHPTPYYETQINIMRRDRDLVVNDRGVIYGPWLEGVGSRNKTTRFKGYASFRRARDKLIAGMVERVQPIVLLYIAKMNGKH